MLWSSFLPTRLKSNGRDADQSHMTSTLVCLPEIPYRSVWGGHGRNVVIVGSLGPRALIAAIPQRLSAGE